MSQPSPTGRVVVALGGNAIAPPGERSTADDQQETIGRAMTSIADLIVDGWNLVLTHGNGPQVGTLMIANELAQAVVAPMPLHFLVAQTQATIGYAICNTLEHALAQRGSDLSVVPMISRVLVGAEDPGWDEPTKPIGPYLDDEAEAMRRMEATGQVWGKIGDRGWRRVVPSPDPLALLDGHTLRMLLDAGAVVVVNGGGGIPMVREDDRLRGVEAVVDKDLSGALLARKINAERLVILTDVHAVALHYDTPKQEWLGEITAEELRALQHQGHFGVGSMGPKVEAALRFVEATGQDAVIAALDDITDAVHGRTGTRVRA
ncbi:MAG: carbamate kinase [Nitriliruptorales bacterium]|nr:carbamate kinase [Nitriliruptorales bacterium]